jgi:hypothetical protein
MWIDRLCLRPAPGPPKRTGYSGPVDGALRRAIKLTRYQSSKARLGYPDYAASKAALGCRDDALRAGEGLEEAAGEAAAAYA